MKKQLLTLGALAVSSAAFAQTFDAVNNRYINMVTADVTANTTWNATHDDGVNGLRPLDHVLQGSLANQGAIRVWPGITLTISPGTVVRGQPQTSTAIRDPGSLIVLRGARVVASGSPSLPIVFTSAAVDSNFDNIPDGFARVGFPTNPGSQVAAERYAPAAPKRFWDTSPLTSAKDVANTGLWGGLVILGRAPHNRSVGSDIIDPRLGAAPVGFYDYTLPIVEGISSPVGEFGAEWTAAEISVEFPGSSYVVPAGRARFIDQHDDSGIYRYISVRHAGSQLSADNELNGVTLAGVGRGTVFEYIEVWGNDDDGIEWFGGTVDCRYLVVVGAKDDAIDLDFGYQGNIQFVLVVQCSVHDAMNEWDGDDGANTKANYEPRGSWVLANGTFIGGPNVSGIASPAGLGKGLVMRNNSAATIFNSIFVNLSNGNFGGSPFVPAPGNILISTSTLQNNVRGITVQSPGGLQTISSGNTSFLLTNNTTASAGIATPTFVASTVSGLDTPGMFSPATVNPRPSLPLGFGLPVTLPVANRFFTTVGYRGAFSNATGVPAWTSGWSAINLSGVMPTVLP